ncbi:MAG: gephyrin-like molybdotransferase Glp [Acidobacteriota bacterium]
MIAPEEAWARIARELDRRQPQTLSLPRRQAAGRTLAEALAARVDVPASDVSAMDGYALGGDFAPGGEPTTVVGAIRAGDPPGFVLPAGAAVRIMTGAPIPEGADRVIPVEQTDGGSDRVISRAAPAAGDHIRRRGEIQRAGDPLFPAGARLGPGALSLLATHGYGDIPVVRPPTVAILATGDEVVPPELEPGPGQLRDSHTDFLLAACRSFGLAADSLGIAPDRQEELSARIERGLGYDVLLLCGGVSMGEHDLVEGVLTRLGCRIVLDKVAIQPGQPLVFAVHDGGIVFGLPGNPASVMACFWLFVRPALRRWLGVPDGFWHGALAAELEAPLPGTGARDRFLTAAVTFSSGAIRATPNLSRGSHDLGAFALGTALVRVRAGAPPQPAGARCEILPLGDWRE